MKTCRGCHYAVWEKNKLGRLHPSGNGRCTVKVKIPELPNAFHWYSPRTVVPMGGLINRKQQFEVDCKYYQPEKK